MCQRLCSQAMNTSLCENLNIKMQSTIFSSKFDYTLITLSQQDLFHHAIYSSCRVSSRLCYPSQCLQHKMQQSGWYLTSFSQNLQQPKPDDLALMIVFTCMSNASVITPPNFKTRCFHNSCQIRNDCHLDRQSKMMISFEGEFLNLFITAHLIT